MDFLLSPTLIVKDLGNETRPISGDDDDDLSRCQLMGWTGNDKITQEN